MVMGVAPGRIDRIYLNCPVVTIRDACPCLSHCENGKLLASVGAYRALVPLRQEREQDLHLIATLLNIAKVADDHELEL